MGKWSPLLHGPSPEPAHMERGCTARGLVPPLQSWFPAQSNTPVKWDRRRGSRDPAASPLPPQAVLAWAWAHAEGVLHSPTSPPPVPGIIDRFTALSSGSCLQLSGVLGRGRRAAGMDPLLCTSFVPPLCWIGAETMQQGGSILPHAPLPYGHAGRRWRLFRPGAYEHRLKPANCPARGAWDARGQ